MTAAADPIAPKGSRHKTVRRALLAAAGVTVASIVLPRLFGFGRSDHAAFDRRRFPVTKAVDGDRFVIDDSRGTIVTLIGVDAPDLPDGHCARDAADYLAGRLRDTPILLKLDGTQTRDDDGQLLAYAYLTDTDLLNADIIRDGRAYADRRMKHTFGAQFAQLENEARKRKRGLWESVSVEQQPAWRRDWLRSLNP